MSAVFYAPAFAALTRFFGADAVRALTVLTLVAGFASTVFAPLTAPCRRTWAGGKHIWCWRWSWLSSPSPRTSSGCVARGRRWRRRTPWNPRRVPRAAAVRRADRGVRACGLASYAVIANLVPLMGQRGISTGAAAVALGLGGAGQVLGGWAIKRWCGASGWCPER